MKKFTETRHCLSREHCEACRTDDEFVRSIKNAFEWNGKCPHGYTAADFLSPGASLSMPPIHEQVENLAGAVGRVAATLLARGQVLADEATRAKRTEVCGRCELLSGIRCSRCGCHTPKKVALQTESCPDGRW